MAEQKIQENAVTAKLTILVAALVASGCTDSPAPPPESGGVDPQQAQAPPDPFGTPPRHPPEVARLLKLLPDIPADGSPADVVRFLGLPDKPTYWEASTTHYDMTWDVAPGYTFFLGFSPWFSPDPNDQRALEFASAGFSACGKPGFPPDSFQTVYPYRTDRGMVTE
jgi:hypothetical protein